MDGWFCETSEPPLWHDPSFFCVIPQPYSPLASIPTLISGFPKQMGTKCWSQIKLQCWLHMAVKNIALEVKVTLSSSLRGREKLRA